MKGKKGFQVGDILPLAIVLVVATIGIGIGADILSDTQENFDYNVAGCNSTNKTGCTYAYNISGEGLTGVSTFGDYLPTIALIVVAAVIIGVLVTYLTRQ